MAHRTLASCAECTSLPRPAQVSCPCGIPRNVCSSPQHLCGIPQLCMSYVLRSLLRLHGWCSMHYLLLATRYLLLNTCYLFIEYVMQIVHGERTNVDTCYLPYTSRYLLFAACYSLLTTHYLLLATCDLLLATCYLLTTYYLPLTTHYSLLSTGEKRSCAAISLERHPT